MSDQSNLTEEKSFDLGQLFNKYGSDKDVNGYTSLYHTLFNNKKDTPITLLEIGIGTMIPNVHSSMAGYGLPNYKPGGSLRAWRDFFSKGKIYGLDVQPDTQFSDEERIITDLCDSSNGTAVDTFMNKVSPTNFDIIIDDGSHLDQNQLKTLHNFYPYLKEGGIYIIEDIYPGSRITVSPECVGKNCNFDPYFFSGIKNNLCVIYKNNLKGGATKKAF